jgi:hypothetical protein
MKSKNLWLEFDVEVTRPDGLVISVCGLCANTVEVNTTSTAIIFDKPAGIKTFCICPNGRAIKKHKE